MNKLENAIRIAFDAHYGQKDRANNPYIFHPLWVMLNGRQENKYQIVAVLHDVVEDSELTIEELQFDFDEEIITALICLTKLPDEEYFDYINRIKKNEIASAVKWVDLIHNSQMSRLNTIIEKDKKRYDKYQKALEMLR